MSEQTTFEAKWKRGETIREITTGKPYSVIHIFLNMATLVVSLESPGLAEPLIILPRDYTRFALDYEMDTKKKGERLTWVYQPLHV